jgi:hypothetical protein
MKHNMQMAELCAKIAENLRRDHKPLWEIRVWQDKAAMYATAPIELLG